MPDIPTNNTELYLANIAGESDRMPDFPTNKIERYLQKIATKPTLTPEQVVEAVTEVADDWLEDNIAQETGYALDSSLTMSNAAAPADKVGELKSALNKSVESVNKGLNVYTGIWTDEIRYNSQGQLLDDHSYWRTDFITLADFAKVSSGKDGLFVWCGFFNADKTFATSFGQTMTNGQEYTLPTNYAYVIVQVAKSTGDYSDVFLIGGNSKAISNEIIYSSIDYSDLVAESENETAYMPSTHGKNLYNPNTFNKLQGFYFAYNSGIRSANSGFTAVVVPVTAGTVLSFNAGNIHVCAVSEIPDMAYFATHSGKLNGYISGFADANPKQGYTVPADAVALVVSAPTNSMASIQVEVGSSSTAFESYYSKILATDVIGLNADFIVGANQMYTTITDAIAAASDGDTILVMPGTYTEAIDCRAKNIKIKGFSRDSCVLTYPASDYLIPPLEMAKGVVEDMTIIATGSTLAEGATYLAYCVHIDFGEERNNSLQFKNCRFVNDARQCVGIGLRGNYRLSFVNCELECGTDGCVYLHEEQASNVNGQYVEFIDCSMKRNSSGDVICMQESPAYSNNSAIVRFQRNILVNAGGTKIVMQQYGSQPGLTGSGYLGSTNWTLDTASALNSDSLLNA